MSSITTLSDALNNPYFNNFVGEIQKGAKETVEKMKEDEKMIEEAGLS